MTLLTEAKYEDRCSECGKKVNRVYVYNFRRDQPPPRNLYQPRPGVFRTSCCQAKAIAVRVE